MRLNAKFLAAAVGLLAFTSALDQPAGSKLWDFFTGTPIQSSPAVGADGTVYFGADNGKLYAFDPQGQGKWEFPTGDAIVASPAITVDGTVVVGSLDGQLYAVGADGVERWRFRADGKIVASPAIGRNGVLHFGSMQNTVYAVSPDGAKVWEFTADDAIVASPAVGRDGTTYAVSLAGTLYALDLAGKPKWKFKAGEKVNSSPALAADGTIYFGAFDGHVYAINPNGSKKWTAATGAAVRGSAAIGPDGVIYIGSDDRKLYAFAPDGFKLWTFTTGGWVRSTPAVSTDGTLYFGSYDNSLHAVSAAGLKAWEFTTDSAISSSPALAPNGAIYFGGWSKRFYAVKGGAGLAANAWAKFRGDARQSAFAQMEFAPAQYVRTAPSPVFPVEEARPLAVTGKAAAAEEFARAQAARELAMAAKQDATARTKAAALPPPVAPKPPDAGTEAKRLAKAEADANRRMLADNARLLKEAELARKAQAEEDHRRALAAAEFARNAKRDAGLREAAALKAAADAGRLTQSQRELEAKAQTEADRQAAMEAARQTRLQHEAERMAAEAKAKADAQAQLEETRRTLEESKRLVQEAEAARLREAAEAEQRAAAAAELARLAKREADQRAAARLAAEQADLNRARTEAQAAEAAQRQAAEAEKLRQREQEIARKVMADSEQAAREEQERQAREEARAAAAERRRLEAERRKWEPVSGGFFRRLFGGGSSEPKVKVVAEAPAAPAAPVPAPVPPPEPVVPAPVFTPPVATETVVIPPVVSAPAPGVPMRIISDSSELVRPVASAAPAPPANSFFTPAQPTVDPLAEQIEQLKQRAAAAQVQPVPPQFVQPQFVQPAVPQPMQPAAEVATEEPAPEEKAGFWTGVRNFFIRKRPDPQAQPAQRPMATWPPAGVVVGTPRTAAPPVQTQVPAGLAPGGMTATNFPRVQYAPVTNQGGLFLPRAMAMQTNIPGMPQPPSPPREVREMRPSKIGTQGLSADLPGAAAPIEIIQGRIKAPIRVYATGPGRVIPDLNGADLEVGQAYTVEAQPARGAVFLGWAGSLETNTPTLRFIMRTGTILMANFQFGHNLERELPEVAITAPADGARLATAAFTLQGMARDNLAVARVEVSLNDGPWQPAQGTDHWMFQGAARPGPNYVRVRAVDAAGNESAPLLRSLNYSVPAQLSVRVNGAGTVEPDWNGRLLEVGAAYELRATPAAGHVFTGWSGGVSGASAQLQFTMQPGLVVEANFAPRVASLARGVFNGLVYPTNSLAPAKCGFFQLEAGADGSFSGFLRQGVASHGLSGRFDSNGQAAVLVNRAGQAPLSVVLQLDTTAGERVNGRFTDDGQVVELFGYRQVFDGQAATTPLAGRYTFVIPSPTNAPAGPGGDAFGELVVDGAGQVRFAGELPDGTPVRHEAVVGRNGLWPLHVPLAGGRGMLLGWLTLTNHAQLDAYGEVIWHKPLAPQDRFYPNGFSTRRHLFGTRYTPTGTASLSGDRRIGGMLSGGNLDKIVLGDPGPAAPGLPPFRTLQRFSWNFRPDTGYVEGTFIHPVTQQETTFRGALLQKVGWTSGYFLGQNHSGVVHLQLPQ